MSLTQQMRYMEQRFQQDLEQAVEAGVDDEDNMPFLYLNDDPHKAVVLAHGFRATPWETKELGEILHGEGFTVYGARLEGHGTTPEQFKESTWQQWYGSVEYAYQSLQLYSQQISVVGVSLGGLLSLMTAQKHRGVRSVVTMAAPIKLAKNDLLVKFVAGTPYIANWVKRFGGEYLEREVGEEGEGHYYDRVPVDAVVQLIFAMQECRRNLREVEQPTLILQATQDPTVHLRSAALIHHGLRSIDRRLVKYDDDKHVLLKSDSKDEVMDDIVRFLIQMHYEDKK